MYMELTLKKYVIGSQKYGIGSKNMEFAIIVKKL